MLKLLVGDGRAVLALEEQRGPDAVLVVPELERLIAFQGEAAGLHLGAGGERHQFLALGFNSGTLY